MESESSSMPFGDFPEDLQLSILSFLSPAEISSFARTSRRFADLCRQAKLWFSMCDRRWGSKTLIRRWASPGAPFWLIYKTLDRWETLIGFWRHVGRGIPGTPPIVFFEWGSSFITGSRISPSTECGSYGVHKTPFLWMGLSPRGEPVSFIHEGPRFEQAAEGFVKLASGSEYSDMDLVQVAVSFKGGNHFVLEENRRSYHKEVRGDDEVGLPDEGTSPPDRLMSEIYHYFANRTSPGGEKASRRQRRKREKERLGRWILESDHFVKIASCPTPARPLQGLWKGICDSMNLDFYLVIYDECGCITCRRVGYASEPLSGNFPVFWASNTTFLEFPFSGEEEDIYHNRQHVHSLGFNGTNAEGESVSRILCINSSYDLVIPGSSVDPRNIEGRIWEYKSGTFGFGFLRDNFIVDLKHIAMNGRILDTIELSCNDSSL